MERTPGFQVVGVAHNAAEAMRAVTSLDPELVLLDVYLPDVLGLDLLQQMRDVSPDLDVIVISAAREADTVRRALRGGIVHYLIKPFSYEDLRERLVHYSEAYGQLDSPQAEAEQSDVDRLFNLPPRPSAATRLPKGFSAETLRLVAEAVKSSTGDLSASEVGEAVGIARVSARRYLEHLVSQGHVEVRLEYGRVGRPERRYGWG